VQPNHSTVAVDADGRLDIYLTKKAALATENAEPGDRLVCVKVTMGGIVGRVADLQ
jgi:hypothetical protein